MTLPTTSPLSGNDDDSDMFGPPRSSPVGYHQRSRVPMISPKLRQREERKRILQLCAHKLERIKDSEANLRRSVCINNTYSRLTDEVRREKQSRYLANLPKSDTKPETAHDNMYSPYSHNYTNQMELRNESYHKINHHSPHHHNVQESFNNNSLHSSHQKHKMSPIAHTSSLSSTTSTTSSHTSSSSLLSASSSMGHSNGGMGDSGGSMHSFSPTSSSSSSSCGYSSPASYTSSSSLTTLSPSSSHHSATTLTSSPLTTSTITSSPTYSTTSPISSTTTSSSSLSSSSVDADLEILDRELSAINASMPLIDPEITQGAEQLEKAVSSRKRSRTEEENDRLVREALSQFYLPTQRVISALDDYPPEIKRTKFSSHCNGLGSMSSCHSSSSITDLDLDLGLDMTSHHHLHHHHLHHHHHHHHHQSQKEFEVIMDALRLSTGSPTPSAQDSCGQAAMMSESGVFHNLVVTSLET